jgi:ribulose 1,5-bisphosphate synthetase/thiazole synthase
MPERFDAVVLGAGPAGEVAVGALAAGGLRCALVERELIGGASGSLLIVFGVLLASGCLARLTRSLAQFTGLAI